MSIIKRVVICILATSLLYSIFSIFAVSGLAFSYLTDAEITEIIKSFQTDTSRLYVFDTSIIDFTRVTSDNAENFYEGMAVFYGDVINDESVLDAYGNPVQYLPVIAEYQDYNAYKQRMMKYMTEELADKYLKMYAREKDGDLYVHISPICEESWLYGEKIVYADANYIKVLYYGDGVIDCPYSHVKNYAVFKNVNNIWKLAYWMTVSDNVSLSAFSDPPALTGDTEEETDLRFEAWAIGQISNAISSSMFEHFSYCGNEDIVINGVWRADANIVYEFLNNTDSYNGEMNVYIPVYGDITADDTSEILGEPAVKVVYDEWGQWDIVYDTTKKLVSYDKYRIVIEDGAIVKRELLANYSAAEVLANAEINPLTADNTSLGIFVIAAASAVFAVFVVCVLFKKGEKRNEE